MDILKELSVQNCFPQITTYCVISVSLSKLFEPLPTKAKNVTFIFYKRINKTNDKPEFKLQP